MSEYALEIINNKLSYLDEKKINQLNSEKESLQRKNNALSSRISKLEKEKKELKTRIKLNSLPGYNLANKIILDNKHVIYYYHYEIGRLINDDTVKKEQLEKILLRFKTRECGNNKELKSKLIKRIKTANE